MYVGPAWTYVHPSQESPYWSMFKKLCAIQLRRRKQVKWEVWRHSKYSHAFAKISLWYLDIHIDYNCNLLSCFDWKGIFRSCSLFYFLSHNLHLKFFFQSYDFLLLIFSLSCLVEGPFKYFYRKTSRNLKFVNHHKLMLHQHQMKYQS